MYTAQQSSNIQKLHKVVFFSVFLDLELMPMQLRWIKYIQMSYVIQNKYINQNFLCKTKFGSWYRNILKINLLLKIQDRTLCNLFL